MNMTAIEGTVVSVHQLTPTGFAEVTVQDQQGQYHRAAGGDLMILRNGDKIVLIAREEIKRNRPQIRIVRWWTKERCPFQDIEEARKNIEFLTEMEIPPAIAQRIFDGYLHETRNVILDNPYRIAVEGIVKRVGVKTIDDYIAPKFQIAANDRRRLKAEILTTLRMARGLYGIPVYENGEETYGNPGGGHVYVDFSQVAGLCAESMDLDRKTLANELRKMALEPRNPLSTKPLIAIEKDEEGRDRYIYLHALHTAEKGLAHHTRRILSGRTEDLSLLDIVTPGLQLSTEQESAVRMALREPFSIITGGPGVGKTTIIKSLTSTLSNAYIDFALCAPTGVAARRMTRATDQPASTIHRLLKVDPIQGAFSHNRSNPLGERVVICDESSMIDIALMFSLFDAIATGARVVLVGDADQLPPVGPGAPFRDLVAWGKIPTARLLEVRRQELSDSLIIKGSRDILAQRMPTFCATPPEGDLYVCPYVREEAALQRIIELVTDRIPKTFGIPPSNIQVLCPHRRMMRTRKKGDDESTSTKLLASENINLVLQEKLTGKPPEGQKLNVGDRVIQTRNNYDLDVMNGEIGYVKEAHVKEHTPRTPRGGASMVIRKVSYLVEFDEGKRVLYDDKDAEQLELAYALSIHKSQGSEFAATIVIAYHSGNFFSRNMLYTAITRGKRIVTMVSPKGARSLGLILKTSETKRASRLIWRLENETLTDSDSLSQLNLDDLSEGE